MSGRPPPDTNKLYSCKVDNIDYRTTTDDLRHAFSKYGEIGDVYIPTDRYTQEPRGFAFVRYYEARDMDDAIDAMDGGELDGRTLKVYEASQRAPPREDGYRGGGGGGGGGGYGGGRGGRSRSRSPRRDRRDSRRSRSRSRSRS